jgi:NAD(P)H dehydrogenase (quinone)
MAVDLSITVWICIGQPETRGGLELILVTGASGYVGGAILRRLRSLEVETVAMVRNPETACRRLPSGTPLRIADYEDSSALCRAFAGTDQIILVSSDGDARAVMRHHAKAIAAAAEAGPSRIIFMSIVDIDPGSPFYYAPVYRDAERRLAASGVPSTILRCGLYSDFILDHWLNPAFESGEVILPAGQGPVVPISREDVASAIVAIASQPGTRGRSYALTGPRALTLDGVIAAFSDIAGRPIRYSACPRSDYLAWTWANLEDPWPHAFSTLCESIGEGRFGGVSNDFAELVGREPEGLSEFLRRTFSTGG